MSRTDTFESALATAFARLADMAPIAVDAQAMTATAAAAPSSRAGARLGAGQSRRIAFVGIAAMLALGAALALLGAARLLEHPGPDVFGRFGPTGQLPPSVHGDRYVKATATLHDGRVLAMGMYADSGPDDAWASLYDPRTNTWAETRPEPGYRQDATATTLEDGRILIVGGWRTDRDGNPVLPAAGELYDPTTDAFEPTPGLLTTPRYGHTATLLADGRVLVVGGSSADFNATLPEMTSAEIFDPATGTFTQTGLMAEPRELHAAVRLPDGRVLITGGMTSRAVVATRTAEIFDPASEKFTPTGLMTAPRATQAMTLLADGRVLVVAGSGGARPTGEWTPIASAELYDPTSGQFTATASLATERFGPALTVLSDGRALVAGGSNDFGAPRSAELFDPVRGRFVAAGSSTAPHSGGKVATLPDGRVLVIGNDQDPTDGATAEVWERFDHGVASVPLERVAAPEFSTLASQGVAMRSGQTATRLADGRVLLTGGIDDAMPGGPFTRSAEILDPRNGRSVAVGDMAVARSEHVAVLLPDGRVLVAGGEQEECPSPDNVCSWPVPTAEIFDPTTRMFTTSPADIGPAAENSRGGGSAAIGLGDGRVLYTGPTGSGDSARVTTVIDPMNGIGTPVDPVPCSSRLSLVRLADGRVFVQCGVPHGGAFVYDASGHLTRVATGSWDAAVGLADGRVLVLLTTGATAIFDPRSGSYTPSASITSLVDNDPNGRYGDPYPRRLTLLPDGRVLISGGQTLLDEAFTSLPIADLFDPAAGTSRVVGPMFEPRYRHSATLLKDGRVLIVGGVTRSPDRSDPEPPILEIFDPDKIGPD